MVDEVSAVNFRLNPDGLLEQAQCGKDSIITKDGKPVAALVNAALFARICRMRARFDGLSDRIAEACAEVPDEEGLAEIEVAVAAVRQQR